MHLLVFRLLTCPRKQFDIMHPQSLSFSPTFFKVWAHTLLYCTFVIIQHINLKGPWLKQICFFGQEKYSCQRITRIHCFKTYEPTEIFPKTLTHMWRFIANLPKFRIGHKFNQEFSNSQGNNVTQLACLVNLDSPLVPVVWCVCLFKPIVCEFGVK